MDQLDKNIELKSINVFQIIQNHPKSIVFRGSRSTEIEIKHVKPITHLIQTTCTTPCAKMTYKIDLTRFVFLPFSTVPYLHPCFPREVSCTELLATLLAGT